VSLTTRQRAAVNVAGIIACQAVTMVLSVALVPFMIGRLGKEDYGIFQLVRSFIGYLPMLTLSVGPAVSRYVTHAVGRDDRDAVSRYMSNGLAAMLAMSAIVMIAAGVLAFFLPSLFDLGRDARPAQSLLVMLAGTIALGFVSAMFTAPLYARERLAETNVIQALGDILRSLGIVALFMLMGGTLERIGVATLAGAMFAAVLSVVSAWWVFPWLRISLRGINRQAMRDLLSFSAFSSIAALVWALYYNTHNLLIKWIYGPAGAALITVYSVASCWDPWIRSAVAPLVRIIMPRMTLLSAQQRAEDMRRLTLTGIRYATTLVAPVCVLVSVFARPVLQLWVGRQLDPEDVETAARVIPIFLVPLIFAIGTSPSQAVFVAEAKLAVPTLAALVGAIANVAISVLLCKYAGWGLAGLAFGTGGTLMVLAIVFVPWYLRRLSGLPYGEFFGHAVGPPALLAAALAGACAAANHVLSPRGVLQLGVTCAAAALAYGVAAFALILRPHDRASLVNAARRLLILRSA